MESIFEEEKLFSDEEIIDSGEVKTQATKGNGEISSVKEEVLDMKEEVDFKEMLANGSGVTGGEPESGGNAKDTSFNAHVLFSSEYPVKEEVEENGAADFDEMNDDYGQEYEEMLKTRAEITAPKRSEKQCPLAGCTEKLRSNEELVKQMKKHSFPWVCGVCGVFYPYASQLRNHYRIHTREKPFKCATCGFKTAHSSSLLGHIKTFSH